VAILFLLYIYVYILHIALARLSRHDDDVRMYDYARARTMTRRTRHAAHERDAVAAP